MTILFTESEAAEILGMPLGSLAHQRRIGNIPAIKSGHYIRFTFQDLERHARRRQREGIIDDGAKMRRLLGALEKKIPSRS